MTRYRERQEAGEFAPPADELALDSMTKAELLAEAKRRGVEVAESSTKAEIQAALEAAE